MPIYEYSCINCGHYLTKLQKITDQPIVACPDCGELQMRKLVSAAGFQLKGTGWYATDFRNSTTKPKSDTKEDSAGNKETGKNKSEDSASKEGDNKNSATKRKEESRTE